MIILIWWRLLAWLPAEFESTKIAMFMNEFANLTQSIKKIKDLGSGHDFWSIGR